MPPAASEGVASVMLRVCSPATVACTCCHAQQSILVHVYRTRRRQQKKLGMWQTGAAEGTRHELLGVAHHRLEQALQGQLQVVVQVVLEVDGQVVLQRKNGVLRLLVDLHALRALRVRAPAELQTCQPECLGGHAPHRARLDDDVGDAVADGGRGGGIALAHLLGQLHVRLLRLVCRVVLGQRLRMQTPLCSLPAGLPTTTAGHCMSGTPRQRGACAERGGCLPW